MTHLQPAEAPKPLLALDVDGVFIVQATEPLDSYQPPEGFQTHPERKYEYYSPQHGQWINRLLPHTEMCFITSYEENSDIAKLLGLPEIPWLKPYVPLDAGTGLRPEIAIDRQYPDRPTIVIIDDHVARLRTWEKRRNDAGVPTLVIGTDTDRGLQREHVHEVEGWLRNLGIVEV